jgi:hypothetical protein
MDTLHKTTCVSVLIKSGNPHMTHEIFIKWKSVSNECCREKCITYFMLNTIFTQVLRLGLSKLLNGRERTCLNCYAVLSTF